MSGEDGEGAVELLGEDYAGELMREGDWAEREDEVGAGAGCGGPSVGRTDGEDEALRAGVAKAAKVGGEFLGGELFAATVEEDEDRGGAGGLAVEPGEECGFGVVELGGAGDVAGGAGKVVGGEGLGRSGLGARAGRRDGCDDELHGKRVTRRSQNGVLVRGRVVRRCDVPKYD